MIKIHLYLYSVYLYSVYYKNEFYLSCQYFIEMNKCPICLEFLSPDDKTIKCKNLHLVHLSCQQQWNNGCPLCKIGFNPYKNRLRSTTRRIPVDFYKEKKR